MPFDPNQPQPNTPADADQIRAQLNALNADIQTRATTATLNANVANLFAATSNTSNSVATLGQAADPNYNSGQIQDLINKLDELILALRR